MREGNIYSQRALILPSFCGTLQIYMTQTLVSTNFREYVQLNFQPSFCVQMDNDYDFLTRHPKKFDEPSWSSVVQGTVKPKTTHRAVTRPPIKTRTIVPVLTPFELPPPMLPELSAASSKSLISLLSTAPESRPHGSSSTEPTPHGSSSPESRPHGSSSPEPRPHGSSSSESKHDDSSSAPLLPFPTRESRPHGSSSSESKHHDSSSSSSAPLLPFPTRDHHQTSFFFNDFFQSMSNQNGNNTNLNNCVNHPMSKSISKLRQSILASGEIPTQTLHQSYWDSRHGRWVTILYTCFGDVKAQIDAKAGTFKAFGSGYKDAGIEIQQYTFPIVRHEITYQYGEIAIALDNNVWTIVFPCERYKFETSIILQ